MQSKHRTTRKLPPDVAAGAIEPHRAAAPPRQMCPHPDPLRGRAGASITSALASLGRVRSDTRAMKRDRFALGLPDHVTACLFDLDGVLTDTARMHRAAWKQTFDAFLAGRGLAPFTDEDYLNHVDGKPRADGVRDVLASRGIQLPEGDNRSEWQTIHGIGNHKNELLGRCIEREGVTVYGGSRRYLTAARDAGLRRAVVSSSGNTADVLRITGLDAFVQCQVDGAAIRIVTCAANRPPIRSWPLRSCLPHRSARTEPVAKTYGPKWSSIRRTTKPSAAKNSESPESHDQIRVRPWLAGAQ